MFVVGVLFGVLLWLTVFPVMLLFAYAFSFYGARSTVRSNPHALGSVAYRFSGTGYHYDAPNGTGQTLWTAFAKIHETREQFLFYPLKTLAYIVPKRCFSIETDVQDLRRLLQDNYKGEARLLA